MSGDRTFDYLTSIIYACDGDWCYGPHHAITLQYMAKDYGFSGQIQGDDRQYGDGRQSFFGMF